MTSFLSNSTRAQWDEALQSAIKSFRILTAQSDSKSWKPVAPLQLPASGQPSSSSAAVAAIGSNSAGPSRSRAASNTPAGSLTKAPQGSPRPKAASVFAQGNGSHSSSASINGASGITSSPLRRGSIPVIEAKPSFHRRVPFAPRRVDASAVKVHRRSGGKSVGLPNGVDVYRAVVDVPFDGVPDLQLFQNSLGTPEARTKWDSMVDHAETIEVLDPQTIISKTSYRLGWPASNRDAIGICRSMSDGSNTMVSVSTSLPRSADAPSYLRPSPPYVRSHVHLAAWCIQLPDPEDFESDRKDPPKIRITSFWSWDLRGAWLGMPSGGLGTHISAFTTGLIKFVGQGASQVPSVSNYGPTVEILSSSFDTDRDTLSVEYIVLTDEPESATSADSSASAEAQASMQHRRQLGNAVELSLPAEEGWDVKVAVSPQEVAEETAQQSSPPCRATAERRKGGLTGDALATTISLLLDHSASVALGGSARVKVTIQRIAASSDIRMRINDEPSSITEVATSSSDGQGSLSLALLSETASLSGISLASTASEESSRHRATESISISQFSSTKRNSAIASTIRRNYIYFTSMLQEPEAKWKPLSDSKGVTVTQLDSIDPTLVVYRAEATFVGVGVWDIFASISSPGTKAVWDKTLDETKLLSQVGDVSSLWQTKTKAAWPVSARDAVMIETSYKSPTSVHVFSFSTDDRTLFPMITPPAMGTIRTQVDLRGWSVESLNPTTVHVTLIEQSDPKGWTSKSATPAAMTAAVAGVGDYAIKSGAPPVLTRILGAALKEAKYDHEKGIYRLEYSRAEAEEEESGLINHDAVNVECELRCDVESWAPSLDLLVDPPPIHVSCLRRHKLSPGGGGIWLTVEHVPASLEDDTARVTVRRGSSREKGIVTVNGAKMKVDIDELKETEVAQLKDKKRSKPQRVPLDLRVKAGSSKATTALSRDALGGAGSVDSRASTDVESVGSVPSRVGTPAPAETDSPSMPDGTPFSDKQPKYPMTPALDVLFLLRRISAERSPDPAVTPAGWALVSSRNGLYVRRKMMQSISSTVAVQRGDKVVQGVTAEDMMAAVSSLNCRKRWDERVESTKMLGSYGDAMTTSFITTAGAFPFRGRGFYLASLTARAAPSSSPVSDVFGTVSSSLGPQSIYYHASASFPETTSALSPTQVNPTALPIGKILVDGWILETLDPYNSTLNYQIPSTRCTHIVAVDYAGSLPLAVNTLWNAPLPKSINAVEAFLKGPGAVPAVRAPPSFVQVMGDGRDEDHDYIWSLGDHDQTDRKRSTLLFSNFSPNERRLEVLLQVPKQDQYAEDESVDTIDANRTPSASDASTTKALASTATSVVQQQQSPKKVRATTSSASLAEAFARSGNGHSLKSKASSAQLTPTPSTIRTPRASIRPDVRPPARPIVLADVEIELKHYLAGYKLEVHSELGPETLKDDKKSADVPDTPGPQRPETEPDAELVSVNKTAKTKKDLPLDATIYDLPPSAVLAATLDPSARPRRHLLRLSLPLLSDATKKGELDDNATEVGDAAADWRNQLTRQGATIRVIIRPVRSEAPAVNADGSNTTSAEAIAKLQREAEELDSQLLPVHYGGRKLSVVHVNQTSAMLQREYDIDTRVRQLKRIPRKGPTAIKEEDTIPSSLLRPKALASDLKEPPKPLVVAPKAVRAGEASATSGTDSTTRDAKASTGQAKAKDGQSGADGAANTEKVSRQKELVKTMTSLADPIVHLPSPQKESVATTATSQLMGLLQSYPLSRLGASTAVSNISASGEGGRQRTAREASGPVDKGKAVDSASKEGKESEQGLLGIQAPAILGGKLFHEARYSLATLLVVALICLLAGSLLRAMLSPADFIFYTTDQSMADGKQSLRPLGHSAQAAVGAAAGEVQRLLSGEGGGSGTSTTSLLQQGGGSVAWRKVLRLIEIKRAIAGRFDLILAVVDRRLL